jgi:hypothetical protein
MRLALNEHVQGRAACPYMELPQYSGELGHSIVSRVFSGGPS